MIKIDCNRWYSAVTHAMKTEDGMQERSRFVSGKETEYSKSIEEDCYSRQVSQQESTINRIKFPHQTWDLLCEARISEFACFCMVPKKASSVQRVPEDEDRLPFHLRGKKVVERRTEYLISARLVSLASNGSEQKNDGA
ncbi:unnamed protein product [Victoria cruziana]